MAGYFPVDREIFNSTVWVGTDSDTKVVWMFLIGTCNINNGIVSHTLPALARDTGVTRDKLETILKSFLEPDPCSRTPDNDGRRIELVDPGNMNGGIRILNYAAYKEKARNYSTYRAQAFDERNPGRKHKKEGNAGQRGATQGNTGQPEATRATKEKEKEKETDPERANALCSLADSEPGSDTGAEIASLEARYRQGLPTEAREAVALARKNGKVTNSVWLKLLRQLATHPAPAVEEGVRLFVENHADGEKSEAYLLGIVRRLAKGTNGKTHPIHTRAESDALDVEHGALLAELDAGVTVDRRSAIMSRLSAIAEVRPESDAAFNARMRARV